MIKGMITVEEKLRQLYRLQKIDSKTDEIKVLQGELPIEVEDLKDEIAGLEKRIRKLQGQMDEHNTYINNNKTKIAEAESLIGRYTKQLEDVKNNREFTALTKEMKMQKLEIDLANKRIRDTKREIESRQKYLTESEKKCDERKNDLRLKEDELTVIIAETAKEREALEESSKEKQKEVEPRLLQAYLRIRKTYRNGLAVVSVDRDACGGCFGKIPPQRQLELKQRKKLILCEHCGRILIDGSIEEAPALE